MQADLPTLQALLARVEAATGPDREIDAHLMLAFGDVHDARFRLYRAPQDAFTASVDAALALIERVLPGWGWFLRRDDTDANGRRAAPVYNAALLYPYALRVTPGSAQHAHIALALLAAMLRAMIAEREAGHV